MRCPPKVAPTRRLLLSGFLQLCLASVAAAAPITWTPAQDTTDPSDIVLAGTLVEAFNGTGAGTSPSVNGVSFLANDTLLARSYAGDILEGASSGDAGLDALLMQFDYGNGPSTSISIGGGALVPGEQYLLQVFFTDLRSCCDDRTMTFGDGLGGDVVVGALGSGLGQYASGTFTADAASQPLSLATSGFANAHINGYQLRAVPEPGTAVLVLLGLAGFALRGRGR